MLGLQGLGQTPRSEPVLTVYASDTVSKILPVVGVAFRRSTGVKVQFKFTQSAELNAAVAKNTSFDVLLTEDAGAMADLAGRGFLDQSTLTGVAILPLILAAEPEKMPKVEMRKGFDLSLAVKGKILLVSPAAGPEGAAAKQALERLGWLEALKPKLGTVPDGRAAVKLLETGAADAAIIYATDMTFSMSLERVAEFPPETYDPIVFTAALPLKAPAAAHKFLSFLLEPTAQSYLKNAGFAPLPPAKP
jgi:molybdate transport system substrate-binding protein